MVQVLEQDPTFATYCRSTPDCTEALQCALSHEVTKIARQDEFRIDRRDKLDEESFLPKMLKGSRMVAARTIAHTLQIRNATMPLAEGGDGNSQADAMDKTLGILVRMAGKDNWSHEKFKHAMEKPSESYRDIYKDMKDPEARKAASKSTFMQGVIGYGVCTADPFICTLPPHKKDYLAKLINSNLEPHVLEEHDWLHRVMLLTRQGGPTDVWKNFKMPDFKHKGRTRDRLQKLRDEIRNDALINAEGVKAIDPDRVYHLDNVFDPFFGRLRSFSVQLNDTLPIHAGLRDLGFRRFTVLNGTRHPLDAHYMRLPGDLRIEEGTPWRFLDMGRFNASFPVPEKLNTAAQKNLAGLPQHYTWFTDSRHSLLPTTLQQSAIPTKLRDRDDPSPVGGASSGNGDTLDPQVLNGTESTNEALDWYGPVWWPPEELMRDLATGLYRDWAIFKESTVPSGFAKAVDDTLAHAVDGVAETMRVTRFPGTGASSVSRQVFQFLGQRARDVALDAMNLPLVRALHLGTGQTSMVSTEPLTEASTGSLAVRFQDAHSLTNIQDTDAMSLFDHATSEGSNTFSWPRWAANSQEWQQEMKSWRSPSTRLMAGEAVETVTEAEDAILAGALVRDAETIAQPALQGVAGAGGVTAQMEARVAAAVGSEAAESGAWASQFALRWTGFAAKGIGAVGLLLIPVFIGLEFMGDCKRPERYTSEWKGKGTSKMPLVQPCTHASLTRYTSIYIPNSTTTVSTPASNTPSITLSQAVQTVVVQTVVATGLAHKIRVAGRSVQHIQSSAECLDPKTASLPDDLVWKPLDDGSKCWRAFPKECTREGKLGSLPTEDGFPLYCKDPNAITGHHKAMINNCYAHPQSQTCQTIFLASFKSDSTPQVTTIVSKNMTMTTTIAYHNQTAYVTPKATTSTVSCRDLRWDMPDGYTTTTKTGSPCPVRTPFECTEEWFHQNTNWLPKEVRAPRYCTEGDPTGHQRAWNEKCIKEPGSKEKWSKKCYKQYIAPPKEK
ncbi:hypothetical protein CBER1_06952 [Cercospora berteroae]|uniref:Uncharacterized protein n=1 Tax=Cercospora berteroae TaxID=357750 RepID=A0A2S6C3X6_9PEZI|nr:hypothetical protein CBER1_06952 [Cercospora berteroae]